MKLFYLEINEIIFYLYSEIVFKMYFFQKNIDFSDTILNEKHSQRFVDFFFHWK